MIQMSMVPGSSVVIQGGVSVTFTIPIVISIGLGQPQIQQHEDPAKQYHLTQGPIPVARPVPCPDCNGKGYHEK
jgi:hypothetical protein